MNSSTKLGISVVLVSLLVLLQGESPAARVPNFVGDLGGKTTVGVYNILDAELTIHFQSKDDDLGIQVLKKGQSWSFTFHPNRVVNTLFYGSFQWDGQLHYFDVYDNRRDYALHTIWWGAKTAGPCYRTKDGQYHCFPWKSAALP